MSTATNAEHGLPDTADKLDGYNRLNGADQGELSNRFDHLSDEQKNGFVAYARESQARVPAGAIVCPAPQSETARLVLAWIRTLK